MNFILKIENLVYPRYGINELPRRKRRGIRPELRNKYIEIMNEGLNEIFK